MIELLIVELVLYIVSRKMFQELKEFFLEILCHTRLDMCRKEKIK